MHLNINQMNNFFVFIYFVSFALIAGGAFAMMWQNLASLKWDKPVQRHPEAPAAGDEVMYVDLTKERLEGLYRD